MVFKNNININESAWYVLAKYAELAVFRTINGFHFI